MKTEILLQNDLIRKNHLVFRTTLTFSLLGLGAQAAAGIGFDMMLFTIAGIILSLLVGFLNLKNRNQQWIPWITLGGLSLVSAGFLSNPETSIRSLLILYLLLATMSIYMNKTFTVSAYAAGLIGHLYALPKFGYPAGEKTTDFIIFIAYFTLCALILFFKERIASYLIQDLREAQQTTEILNASLEQKQQELEHKNEQLLQLNQVKDQILANTSHEFRTPVNGIIGVAGSLVDGVAGPLSDLVKKNLQMIVASGRRLSSLVNDLLDFSKMKNQTLELNLRPLHLNSIVDVSVELNRQQIGKKQLQLINELSDAKLPMIMADENRTHQILNNLISNAIKFTESGIVSVSAERLDQALAVHVADTGIGIKEEHYEKVFKAFEQLDGSITRTYGGTGLGLAVTKQLVQLQGGTITFTSVPEKGTTFTFTIPVATHEDLEKNQSSVLSVPISKEDDKTSAGTSGEEPATAHFSSGEKGHLLIVDDEPINLHVLSSVLSQHDYQLTSANSAVEALALLKNGLQPDLILLDVMMPRMSGYDMLTVLRKTVPAEQLPVILLTAKNQPEDINYGFQCGANDYMVKPFEKTELLARVNSHLQLVQSNRKVTAMRDRLMKMLKDRNVEVSD